MTRIALASGATGDNPAPSLIRLLSPEELAEHERLFGHVYTEEPCNCGDCLSCEVQRIGRRLPGPVRELLSSPHDPRFVLGAEL